MEPRKVFTAFRTISTMLREDELEPSPAALATIPLYPFLPDTIRMDCQPIMNSDAKCEWKEERQL